MPDRVFSYEFRGKFDNLSAGLAANGKAVGAFGDKLTALDNRGAQMRSGLTAVGDGAGRVGLAAAAGVGAIVLATANFEQAMSSVKAATRGTVEELGDLRQAALDAGASTKFSATEAAGAIENLAKAGLSTADILGGGLEGALALAAAGNLEVAAAAEYSATALTQFSLPGTEAAHVADLLAAGAGKAQGEVIDMANALNYAGVPAAGLGVSIEETAGTIALFAKNGIIGEQAGTSLRGMIASLTSPSELAKKQMEALGISVFDAQGKFVGFEGVAGQLQERMAGLTDAERANALGKIFGNEQLQAANVLYREGAAGVETWTQNVDDAGYASETAAIQMDNLKGDVEELGGALQTAFIGAGDGSGGMLRGLTQGLTDAVNHFNELPPAAQSATTGLLAVTAVTGGALWFGSKVVNGIAATNTALGALGVTSTVTAGKVVKSMGLIGAAFAAVDYGSGVFDSISRSFGALDGASESVEELSTKLADSNLGKYAAGLDIDIERLALDLVQYGEKGEYAAEVMEKLGSGTDGFLAKGKGLLDFVGPWIGSTEELALANLDLNSILNDSADLLGSGVQAAEGAATAQDGLSGAISQVAENASMSLDELKAQQEALEDARKAALDTAQGFFNLGDSLNDSKVSLSGWIKDMQAQGEALRNFRVNAEQAGEKGVRQGLIAALQEAGPEGAMRMKQLANATEEEIGKANRAWGRGQREINKYVDQVVGVPPVVGTDVNVNTSGAFAKLREIHAELNGLSDKYVSVWITERHRDAAAASRGPGVVGGTPKKKRATGGPVYGPGGPTDDLIPAMLSNREYVMPVTAVDYYGLDFMEDIRTRRLAEGGSPGGRKATKHGVGLGTSWNVDWMEKALRGFERELRRSEKALSAETKQRDQAIQARDQVRSSVASGLNADIWGPANPWSANGGADPVGRANAVAADAEEFTALVRSLSDKGLDGAALAEVISSGDIERARMMNSLPASALDSFENAINRRDNAVRAASQAASGALGLDAAASALDAQVKASEAQIRAQDKHIKRLENTIDRASKQNARDVTEGVKSAAAQGRRNRG